MGFIALIADYVYRFRWYATALIITGAILLGYVFNLARLCLLVMYYAVVLHLTSLQNKAEDADYLISAALFLIATLLLFAVIHRLRDARNPHASETAADPKQGGPSGPTSRAQYARLAAMGAIVLLGCAGLPQVYAIIDPPKDPLVDVASGRAVSSASRQLHHGTLLD